MKFQSIPFSAYYPLTRNCPGVNIFVMVERMDNNPLKALLTDSEESADPNDLLRILEPYIKISTKNNRVIYTPKGVKVNSKIKVLLYLLARKALKNLELIETEAAFPKDIKENFGREIPINTIYISLKRLKDDGILRSENSAYYLPNFNIHKVETILKENDD